MLKDKNEKKSIKKRYKKAQVNPLNSGLKS
jgi:hypothetical protein